MPTTKDVDSYYNQNLVRQTVEYFRRWNSLVSFCSLWWIQLIWNRYLNHDKTRFLQSLIAGLDWVVLSNSLKFTEKGTISLKVKDLNENIIIKVSDEGIGIAKEKITYIFDRFKQADSSISKNYGGTGLGLPISRELASLLKGKITIKSEENIGTSFELILPKKINNYNNINILEKTEEKK